jgi:tRNA/tmRNA/rRNA uracil-C5-methylase (TrmA/RlmC/RlmD family)
MNPETSEMTDQSVAQLSKELATRQNQLRQIRMEIESIYDEDSPNTSDTLVRLEDLNVRSDSLQKIIKLLKQEIEELSANVTTRRPAIDTDVIQLSGQTIVNHSGIKFPNNLPSFKRQLPTYYQDVHDFLDQLENDLESALVNQTHWRRVLISRVSLGLASWIKPNTAEDDSWIAVRAAFTQRTKSSLSLYIPTKV